MTAKRESGRGFSLSRWSRRKLEATRAASAPVSTAPVVPGVTVPTATAASTSPAPVELPPVESLTFDSDFTAFLRPEVDDRLKRAALKQLFRDPRFNVMDGLDTYIDDYTKADPIPPDVLADLLQRFGGAPEPAPAPAAGVGTSEPADTPPHPSVSPAGGGEGMGTVRSPESGEESAQAERSAGEGDLASPAPNESR